MCTSLAIVGFLLWPAIRRDLFIYTSNTIKDIWDRGFGRVSLNSVIDALGVNMHVIAAVIIANLPQTILSFLYLLYNAIFTSMLSVQEWNSYAHQRKPLRVTAPREGQRSSYYLQLPYRFALTLMFSSGLLHWITSQAIFLARVELSFASMPNWPAPKEVYTISSVCYSTIAIILALPVGSLTVIIILIMGLRKYRYDMPISGSCSAAISAACHANADEIARQEMVLKPLQWGDVDAGFEDGKRMGHLAFSALPVAAPVNGKEYAGFGARRKASS
jgi:hypothetical protein